MKTMDYQPQGLTTKAAQRLLLEVGENRLAGGKKTRPLKIFLGQFKDLMVLILLVSTVLSMLMGETVEAIAIVLIVLVNALLGFFQEYRTERTLEALKNLSAPSATALRDGRPITLPAAELVPGDLVLLKEGDRIPADGVAVTATALSCDESILTGESVPVEKAEAPRPGDSSCYTPQNRLFMGASITKGRGKMLVTGTGMATEMGKIADLLDEIEEEMTPLQRRLDQLGKVVAVGCLGICAIVSLTGILRGEAVFDMIVTGISLAVAAVPEGLPAIVTIALALAVNRILKRNALVRKLHAVETLGCASVICSDKTGTLTENRMTVQELAIDGLSLQVTGSGYQRSGVFLQEGRQVMDLPAGAKELLTAAAACNNARLLEGERTPLIGRSKGAKESWQVSGEPTEVALLVAAAKAGILAEPLRADRTGEIPFDSTRKKMTVSQRTGKGSRVYCKGAPDYLLQSCTHYLAADGPRPLTAAKKQALRQQNDEMASRALRVLGFAYRDQAPGEAMCEEGLIFLGFAGMIDPPRKEALSAVQKCRKAKIRIIMITGDHKLTAAAIAKELTILRPGDGILTGAELSALSDEQLAQAVRTTTVFARVDPSHKLRIVRALKQNGEIVAMTGDGVNDAPAIKEANIGVAMGVSGSDVAKEASSIILLDDNFATLVAAVEEGRTIYANIRRFIRYLLSCNTGEVLTMFLGMLMGMPVVLLPIQILLVNLVTDGLPAIALGFEPAPKDVMNQKPRPLDESIFAGGLMTTILFRGAIIGLTTLAVFSSFLGSSGDLQLARTAALATLIFTQLFHVFECKSENKSILQINPLTNPKLVLAAAFSGGVALAAIYLPPLQLIFRTLPLTAAQLMTVVRYCLCGPLLWAVVLLVQGVFGSRKSQRLEVHPVLTGQSGD